MPIVSARTEARHEGYFRREWASGGRAHARHGGRSPVLLPVVIDRHEPGACRGFREFLAVQWLRLRRANRHGARPLCRRILSGPPQEARLKEKRRPSRIRAPLRTRRRARVDGARRAPRPSALPPRFRVRSPVNGCASGHMCSAGWALCVASLQRFSRWVRILCNFWIASVVLSRAAVWIAPPIGITRMTKRSSRHRPGLPRNTHPGTFEDLGTPNAKQFPTADRTWSGHDAVFAIPFGAPRKILGGEAGPTPRSLSLCARLAKARRRAGRSWIRRNLSSKRVRARSRPRAAPPVDISWSHDGAVLPQAPAGLSGDP